MSNTYFMFFTHTVVLQNRKNTFLDWFKQFWVMYYLEIQGLFKALCKFKDFSRQAVKFKGFSILYEPCCNFKHLRMQPQTAWTYNVWLYWSNLILPHVQYLEYYRLIYLTLSSEYCQWMCQELSCKGTRKNKKGMWNNPL